MGTVVSMGIGSGRSVRAGTACFGAFLIAFTLHVGARPRFGFVNVNGVSDESEDDVELLLSSPDAGGEDSAESDPEFARSKEGVLRADAVAGGGTVNESHESSAEMCRIEGVDDRDRDPDRCRRRADFVVSTRMTGGTTWSASGGTCHRTVSAGSSSGVMGEGSGCGVRPGIAVMMASSGLDPEEGPRCGKTSADRCMWAAPFWVAVGGSTGSRSWMAEKTVVAVGGRRVVAMGGGS